MELKDEAKIPRKWGILHSLAAGSVITFAQFIAFQQFVFPRTEAIALEKRVDRFEISTKADIKDLREETNKKLDTIQSDIKRLIELQSKRP